MITTASTIIAIISDEMLSLFIGVDEGAIVGVVVSAVAEVKTFTEPGKFCVR